MKDKTQAAKDLLAAGWTWDEIESVFAQPAYVPQPLPVSPQPYNPFPMVPGDFPNTTPSPWWGIYPPPSSAKP